MNRAQKVAIFLITAITLTLILGVAAYLRPSFNFGLGPPTTGIVICALVLCTVFGTFYRNLWVSTYDVLRKSKTKIMLDERDRSIHQKAEYSGFSASYAFFVFSCMICWLVTKKDGTISSNALPLIVAGGYFAYELIRSIVILVLYGRPTEDIKTSEGETS
jgi:hypothetical protein